MISNVEIQMFDDGDSMVFADLRILHIPMIPLKGSLLMGARLRLRTHYESNLADEPITNEVNMAFSVTEYLEDLLLATDSEQTHDEDDYNFEIPEFVKEQVSL